MRQPKAQDFRGRSQEELERELANYYRELRELRQQRALAQLPNPKRIKMVKKIIARVRSVLNESGA
jgi:large subunit ribosomal protein L29